MTPFDVTVLSVTLNAAGNRAFGKQSFSNAQVIGNIFSQNASTRSFFEERLNEICASLNVQIRPFLLLDFPDLFRSVSV
jgi:hypothetical protein